jgi:hypothetical protein
MQGKKKTPCNQKGLQLKKLSASSLQFVTGGRCASATMKGL